MEFDIPLKLADLETPQREGALGPKAHVDVAGMSDAEANDLVEQTAYDLCENDALCVLEQDVFDRAYACARDFAALKPIGRIRITDALCSNLSVLSASVASLLASGAGDAADATDVVASHREALKAYACLVHHIADVADAEARATAGVAAATSAPGAGKADKIDSWPRCPQKWALGMAFIVVKLPQFVFCQTLERPKVMQSAH